MRRITVPFIHSKDSEKMKKNIEETLGNLEKLGKDVGAFKELLNRTTVKMFKINEK